MTPNVMTGNQGLISFLVHRERETDCLLIRLLGNEEYFANIYPNVNRVSVAATTSTANGMHY